MIFGFFAAPVFSLALVMGQAQSNPGAGDSADTQGEAMLLLTSEQGAMLRCSAAFALVAHGQSLGNAAASKWPEMELQGREFFVLTMANLMEDTGLSREAVSTLVANEAQALIDKDQLDAVMPACLLMLQGTPVVKSP